MTDSANNPASHENPSQVFATTQWTRVLQARGDSPEAQAALSELCEAYYRPVLRFLQNERRNEDTARELTQEFFRRLLARQGLKTLEPGRGRFRSFLLGAVKHFLAGMRDHDAALKRGGGQSPISLESATDTAAELAMPDPSAAAPDAWFDREWAITVVNRAVANLAKEWESAGKQEAFAALKPWLLGAVPSLSQSETARLLGWTEGAVKVAIHRLRKRFRDLIKSEIAHTVEGDEAVQEELRYLLEVLTQT